MAKKLTPEEWWRGVLTGVDPALPARSLRNIFRLIPNAPRCKFCNGPYQGIGGAIFRMIGKGPSSLTPQLCNQCYGFTSRHLGGTEIELTMLFADVRGSTPLAASMSPMAYSQLISRFFGVANEVFIRSDALLNRLVGDQVIGLYVPGFAGPNHRGKAIHAAQTLLHETGHDRSDGPWLPIGVGVHTGVAFLGSVGSYEHAVDIAVLGDPPNVTARLSSSAAIGEILISEDAYVRDMKLENLEKRQLALKGKSQPVHAYVIKAPLIHKERYGNTARLKIAKLLLTCLPRNRIMTARGRSRRIKPHSRLTRVSLKRRHLCVDPLHTGFPIRRKRYAALNIAFPLPPFDNAVN